MAVFRQLLTLVGALFLLLTVGRLLADYLGIELSLESVRDFQVWIESLGWWGPLVYVLLVVVRLFIGLSSHVILTLGALAFGPVGAVVWGGIGLTLSGVLHYGLGYYLGNAWAAERLGENNERFQRILEKSGVPAIFLMTVHPLGPQAPLTIVAGAVRFHFAKFVAVMAVATPIRAGFYAVLGASVAQLNLVQIVLITLALIATTILPFLHPKTRTMLLGAKPERH